MKDLIKNHIRGVKGFAEDYGIPYNTVCQWANGTRKPPEWLTKLLYSMRDKQDIKQIEIKNEKIIFYCYTVDKKGRTGIYKTSNEKSAKKWATAILKKGQKGMIEKHLIIEDSDIT